MKSFALRPSEDRAAALRAEGYNLFCDNWNSTDKTLVLRLSDDDRMKFSGLPPGAGKATVIVTDLDNNEKFEVGRAPCGLGCYCGAKARLAINKPKKPKHEFKIPLTRADRKAKKPRYFARAYQNEDPDYSEVIIEVTTPSGKRVADVMVTTDMKTGEPLVYCTTDREPDEHRIALYPLREKASAVDDF